MGLFGGASRKVVDNITTGIAATIMEEYDNNKFKNNEFYFEFFSNIAATAQELKIGFLEKPNTLQRLEQN